MRIIIETHFNYWSDIDQTLYCRCGASFRGRAKFTYDENGGPAKIIDRNCPSCGNIDLIRTESDPETFTLG